MEKILIKPTVNKETKPTTKGLNPIFLMSFKLVDKPTAANANKVKMTFKW